ncbi:MAG: hypothetical protein JNM00_01420, partial [Flavobacteriales bacterium]|nr:hypothetical protein [Flavobacteriales bacterium]
MKKFYLSIAALAAVFAVSAQQAPQNTIARVAPGQLKAVKADHTVGILPGVDTMPTDDSR